MIKRIVKLTFQKERIADFMEVFEESKDKIRNFEGCQYMELLQQKEPSNVLFTLSFWDSEAALNNYRHSALFQATWARTKVLFSDRPQAWTTISVDAPNSEEPTA